MVPNVIGYGLPTRAGTAKAHGEPAGEAELLGAKESLGWPKEPRFYVPDASLAFFRQAVSHGAAHEQAWKEKLAAYRAAYPDLAAELERRLSGELPQGWADGLLEFPPDAKGLASRASSGKVLNAIADRLPELAGGSADLAPSTVTWLASSPAFAGATQEGSDSYEGRNFHFGVREHGMGAIVNGMAYHGGMIPFGATFFVFSDYLRPALRVAAISHLGSIWVFTHDSIGVGEDGPTHQPVEHLAALRAIPNFVTLRPADANEVREAWKIAVENRHRPTALVLTRQALPTLDRSTYAPADGVRRGAYVLADLGLKDAVTEPQVILMASGSEVSLIVEPGAAWKRRALPSAWCPSPVGSCSPNRMPPIRMLCCRHISRRACRSRRASHRGGIAGWAHVARFSASTALVPRHPGRRSSRSLASPWTTW